MFRISCFHILLVAVLAINLIACKKDTIVPNVQFNADKTSVGVNEKIVFSISGEADGLSIFTGDPGHEFEKSALVLTEGKDIQKETVYLTPEKFQFLKVDPVIANTPLVDSMATLVGKKFDSKSHPEFLITIFYNYDVAAATIDKIMAYFTVEKTMLAPTGGFATGFKIITTQKNKTLEYSYKMPGTYIVTLVASNVGRKDFGNNTSDPLNDNYNKKYITKTMSITVK